MSKVVIGVFSEGGMAEDAISELRASGYNPKEMSLTMREYMESTSRDTTAVFQKILGAASAGGVLGAIAGLLASFIIPELSILFVGGPVADMLNLTGAAAVTASGTATGILAGGIIGTLTSFYGGVKEGGVLIAVPAEEREEHEVIDLMTDFSADNVKVIEVHDEYTPAYFSDIKSGKRKETISEKLRKRGRRFSA